MNTLNRAAMAYAEYSKIVTQTCAWEDLDPNQKAAWILAMRTFENLGQKIAEEAPIPIYNSCGEQTLPDIGLEKAKLDVFSCNHPLTREFIYYSLDDEQRPVRYEEPTKKDPAYYRQERREFLIDEELKKKDFNQKVDACLKEIERRADRERD